MKVEEEPIEEPAKEEPEEELIREEPIEEEPEELPKTKKEASEVIPYEDQKRFRKIRTDTIDELSPDTGVTIDGLLVKDSGFPSWVKIKDELISSSVQTYDITGLDLDADKAYMILINLINGAAAINNFSLYVSGDYTATNYYRAITKLGSTYAYDGGNDAVTINEIPSNQDSTVEIMMMRPSGKKPRWLAKYTLEETTSLRTDISSVYRNNAANVTSIRLASNRASGIGANTRIIIFKVGG